jgi:hypothetical protein
MRSWTNLRSATASTRSPDSTVELCQALTSSMVLDTTSLGMVFIFMEKSS